MSRGDVALGAALAAALVLAVTWPLPLHLDDHCPGINHMDLRGHLWAIDNAAQGLDHLFHSPRTFAPEGQDLLVVHGGHLDVALAGLLRAAGLSVPAAYDVVVMAYLGLAALAGWALGLRLTGRRGPALVAALTLFLQPFLFREVAQGLVEEGAVGLLALTLLAALETAARPGWRGPAGLAAGIVVTTLASWEYGMFLAFAAVLYAVVLLARGDRAVAAGAWRRLAAGCGAAGIALLPLVVVFVQRMRAGRAALAEALPAAVVQGPTAALTLEQGVSVDQLLAGAPDGPALLLPGVLVAAVAVARRGWHREAPLLGWAVGFGALALGPLLKWGGDVVVLGGLALPLPFAALRGALPFLDWFYWPYRFLAPATVGVAGLAALGVARLGPTPRREALVAGAFALAVLGQAAMTPRDAFPRLPVRRVTPTPDLYDCVAALPPGALIEAPTPTYGIPALRGAPLDPDQAMLGLDENDAQHMYRWFQVAHGRDLVTGVDTPHAVPRAWRVRAASDPTLSMFAFTAAGLPAPDAPAEAAGKLREMGVAAVIVHDRDFADAWQVRAVHTWLRQALGPPACKDPTAGAAAYSVPQPPR